MENASIIHFNFADFLKSLFGVYRHTREFFHSNGDVIITGERAADFDLCSALMAIEQ